MFSPWSTLPCAQSPNKVVLLGLSHWIELGMKVTRSLPIDGKTQSFVFPFDDPSMVTEAKRVLHSGEAFAGQSDL